MPLTAPSRYTLRRVLYVLTAAAGLATSGYAAVIAPLDSRLDQLERKVADKSELVARMAGQLDALIAYWRIPYPPPAPAAAVPTFDFPFLPVPEP